MSSGKKIRIGWMPSDCSESCRTVSFELRRVDIGKLGISAQAVLPLLSTILLTLISSLPIFRFANWRILPALKPGRDSYQLKWALLPLLLCIYRQRSAGPHYFYRPPRIYTAHPREFLPSLPCCVRGSPKT